MNSVSLFQKLLLLALVVPTTLALAQQQGGRRGAAAAAATTAAASEKPAAGDAKKDEPKKEEKEPVLSITDHEITLGGKVIKYKATAGYMAMKDAKGEKTKANIFFVAYTKTVVETKNAAPEDVQLVLGDMFQSSSSNRRSGSSSQSGSALTTRSTTLLNQQNQSSSSGGFGNTSFGSGSRSGF